MLPYLLSLLKSSLDASNVSPLSLIPIPFPHPLLKLSLKYPSAEISKGIVLPLFNKDVKDLISLTQCIFSTLLIKFLSAFSFYNSLNFKYACSLSSLVFEFI